VFVPGKPFQPCLMFAGQVLHSRIGSWPGMASGLTHCEASLTFDKTFLNFIRHKSDDEHNEMLVKIKFSKQ
jgi:hypothetical protein